MKTRLRLENTTDINEFGQQQAEGNAVLGHWQLTKYDLSDAYMNDLSFNISSQSFGGGVRLNLTKMLSLDLGYMYTQYEDREVVTPSPAVNKTDLYSRTNRVLGLGINLKF